ncbi:hypothetical protein CKAH01_00962 [Colletotrichum kahawae]|uniref:Uncharacterized protein n=1 Tax=Colletotrichum kahawae TaxID=34407 RepID=A0AAD9YMB9_COLKA|nr:hypothetical protein CKAH01_00962 [Colletotrichum kahawae]
MVGQGRDSLHCRSLNPTPRNTTLAPPGNGTGWWLDQPRFCASFGCQRCAKEEEDLPGVMEDLAIPSPFGVQRIIGIFHHCFFLLAQLILLRAHHVFRARASCCLPRVAV